MKQKTLDKFYVSNLIYGMPHCSNDHTLIVASEDNAFWRSFVPPLEALPQDLHQSVADVQLKWDE